MNNSSVIQFLNISSFFCRIEEVRDPLLKDVPFAIASPVLQGRPLIEVSPKAKRLGVKKGMPLAKSKAFCQDLVIVAPNFDCYESVGRKIQKYLFNNYPVFEPEGPGKFYIDYSGLEKIYGDPMLKAMSLQKRMKEMFCLDSTVGVSGTKIVSKLASKADKESTKEKVLEVARKEVIPFLAPWPVEVLPGILKNEEGVEEYLLKKEETLTELNLNKVIDIQKLPRDFLTIALGERRGGLIHDCANGADPRGVRPLKKQDAIDQYIPFKKETNDRLEIRDYLKELSYKISNELERRQKFVHEIELSIRYSDFSIKKFKLKSKNSLYKSGAIFNFVNEYYQKKIALRRLGIKSLRLHADKLYTHSPQLNLFPSNSLDIKMLNPHSSQKIKKLQQMMEFIKKSS